MSMSFLLNTTGRSFSAVAPNTFVQLYRYYRVVTINPGYFQPHQDIPGVEVEGFCCDLAEVSSV